MAGSNPDFNAAEFRAGIHLAMAMGAAPNPEEQIVFHFASVLTYNSPVDGDQVPFDPTATVTRAEPPVKRVDCAVEYFDAEGQPTNFGIIAPTRLVITLLDEEYAKVKEVSYVVAHGDVYDFRRTEPPIGLFDVGIYQLHFAARNET